MSDVDVPRLLERLGVKARRVAHRPHGKFDGACPHPDHQSNPHAWMIHDLPGQPFNGYHACLSCGFKGGVVTLVRAVLGCSGWDAREFLDGDDVRASLQGAVEIAHVGAVGRFRIPQEVECDWDHPPADVTRYLEERGFPLEVALEWRLGYVPPGPSRLAGRIVIPAISRAGGLRSLSYTARSYVGSERRYLEPATLENPEPAAVYGEHLWGEARPLVIVEGAFDAMAVRRVVGGVVDVGAFAGSSIHPLQIAKVLGRPLVLVLTDPDPAGRKFAAQLRDQLVRHVRIVRVDLPSGYDPAKMAQSDPQKLRRILETGLR